MLKAFKEKAIQLSYDRTNISELVRGMGITTPQLYKLLKEFDEFGEGIFPREGSLKLLIEQEKNHELENSKKAMKKT